MPTQTSDRILTMSLCFMAMFVIPQMVSAQQSTPAPRQLPDCPFERGKIGDWAWSASEQGPLVEWPRLSWRS